MLLGAFLSFGKAINGISSYTEDTRSTNHVASDMNNVMNNDAM